LPSRPILFPVGLRILLNYTASDKFPRFDLELPAASVEALNSVRSQTDPNKAVYVKGDFVYDKDGKAKAVRSVDIRIKGEGSFQSLEKKPTLKIKFDKFVEDQRFRGLTRLTLNNSYDDPTFLAERLAYAVHREVGDPAPRCSNARLYMNGEFYGV
jgi:spore coat protein CotH